MTTFGKTGKQSKQSVIAVGNLKEIHEDDETSEARNMGVRGNEGLHGWAFGRFTILLTYKANAEGIAVVTGRERDTSSTWSCAGRSGTQTVRSADCTSAVTVET